MLAATGGIDQWSTAVLRAGAVAFSLTAISVAVAKFKIGLPVRWVFRKLVGEPIADAFNRSIDSHIAPLRKELTPNSGTSLVDKVDKLVRSADDTNARLVSIEEARMEQVPMFLEDHAKLAELHAYAHTNTHAINEAIAVLSTAMQYAEGFVPALGSVGDELKATRQAITDAKGDAAQVLATARLTAENVLREAREHKEGR